MAMLKQKKTKNCVQVTRQTNAISSFMITKSSADIVTVAELTATYHGVRHGHSYLSTDCGNKVSAKMQVGLGMSRHRYVQVFCQTQVATLVVHQCT